MNFVLLGIGIAAISFGCYSVYARKAHPEKLGKLQAMKLKWGEDKGELLHLIGYTISPIIVGVMFILKEVVIIFL